MHYEQIRACGECDETRILPGLIATKYDTAVAHPYPVGKRWSVSMRDANGTYLEVLVVHDIGGNGRGYIKNHEM